MAFWDASALIPLCVHQPASGAIRRLAERDLRMGAWWGTLVEVRSALSRLRRAGAMDQVAFAQAQRRLESLRSKRHEVLPTERLRALAEGLPERFKLSAGDAFQLAAALRWCDERPRRRPFVCLDRMLAEAATIIGFEIEGL